MIQVDNIEDVVVDWLQHASAKLTILVRKARRVNGLN